MLKIIGVLLIIAGVAFGIWAGAWWAFVGGIMQVIEGIKLFETTGAKDIALGILRVVSATFIGGVSFWFVSVIGLVVYNAGDALKRRY